MGPSLLINMMNSQDCYRYQQEASHRRLEEANYGRHKFLQGALTICLHLAQDMLPTTIRAIVKINARTRKSKDLADKLYNMWPKCWGNLPDLVVIISVWGLEAGLDHVNNLPNIIISLNNDLIKKFLQGVTILFIDTTDTYMIWFSFLKNDWMSGFQGGNK